MGKNDVNVKVNVDTKDVKELGSVVSDMIPGFGVMQSGISNLASGIKSFGGVAVKAFSSVKMAIISTGIGALVIAVISLITYFTQTGKGAEELKVIMAGLGAVIDVIVGSIAKMGEWLMKAFNDPMGAIKELGKAIEENIINRFKALGILAQGLIKIFQGKWKEAVKDLTDGVVQLATGTENATDKTVAYIAECQRAAGVAMELEKAIQRLTQAKREDALNDSKMEGQLAKLESIYKDRTKSIGERDAALKQSIKLKQDDADGDIKLAAEALRIEKAKNAELIRSGKGLTEADKDNLSKMEIAYQQSLNKKDQITADSIKTQSAFQLEIKKQQEAFDDEMLALQNETQMLSLSSQEEKDTLALENDIDAKQKKLDRDLQDMTISQEQKDKLQETLDKNSEARRKDLLDKQTKDAAAKKKVDDEKKIADEKKTEEELFQLKVTYAQATMDAVYAFADLARALGQKNKAAALGLIVLEKALAIGEIAMNTAVAISKAAKLGAAGIPQAIAAGVTGGLQTATVIAEGAKAYNAIQNAKRSGGFIYGSSHGNGGVNATLEGGEFVVNKETMRNPRIASSIIQANNQGLAGGSSVGMLTEERVAQIASEVVGSVPVYVVEKDMTSMQRKVEVREKAFVKK